MLRKFILLFLCKNSCCFNFLHVYPFISMESCMSENCALFAENIPAPKVNIFWTRFRGVNEKYTIFWTYCLPKFPSL